MVVCPTPEGALPRSQLPALKEKASDRRAGSPLSTYAGHAADIGEEHNQEEGVGWVDATDRKREGHLQEVG